MGEAIITRRGGGGGSSIKSIQHGIASLYDTTNVAININSVNLNSAIIICTPYRMITRYSAYGMVSAKFLSENQIELRREAADTVYGAVQWNWVVVEFNNVKSVQRGDIIINTADTEHIIPISDINPEKALVFSSFHGGSARVDTLEVNMHVAINNSTSLKIYCSKVDNTYPWKLHWELVEFK